MRVLPGSSEPPAAWSWFCGHCAATAPEGRPPSPAARVCPSCGLGLLLEAPTAAVPGPRDSFVVVDGGLRVQAVSSRAETLLGVSEASAIDRPVTELLVAADAETPGGSTLAGAVAAAAGGEDEPFSLFLRPWNTFGVRARARIAPCGPPRAALIVLEGPRDLRAVGS